MSPGVDDPDDPGFDEDGTDVGDILPGT